MIHSDTLTIDAFWTSDEFFPTEQKPTAPVGRIFHDYYLGSASHLGWMDLVQLRTIIQNHNIKHIILENLDVLGQIAEHTKQIQICNAYLYDGQVIIRLPKKVDFKRCHPQYSLVKFGGWKFSNNCSELPYRVESYMRSILLHTKVESVACYTDKVKVTVYRKGNGCSYSKTEKI